MNANPSPNMIAGALIAAIFLSFIFILSAQVARSGSFFYRFCYWCLLLGLLFLVAAAEDGGGAVRAEGLVILIVAVVSLLGFLLNTAAVRHGLFGLRFGSVATGLGAALVSRMLLEAGLPASGLSGLAAAVIVGIVVRGGDGDASA